MAIHPTSKDPVEGPVEEERDGENLRSTGGRRSRRSHSQAAAADTVWPPGAITPALLRLDPVWDQIRNDPRFQELASEK